MKKLSTVIGTMAIMAMMVTPAFAANLDPGAITGATSKDVNGTTTQTDVYSATVAWGSMAFNYAFGTWNPTDHTWNGAGWSAADFDGAKDQVKITNDSSQPIDAAFAYTKDSAKGGATTGTFTKVDGNLNETGELTGVMALDLCATDATTGPAEETYLNLQGAPAANTTAGKVGAVTVSLTTSPYSSTTELAKILDTTVSTVSASANTEVPVETAMTALAQAAVTSGYTVTMASGAYTPIDATTGTWVGKFTVTNDNTPSNTKTDAADRTIAVVVNIV
ncbi:hypothetical protein GH810_05815 [Acetobacterium paludosum]|uniref:Uncharacterized protein n=1 Tax=Acetobacterium paludosum TaxID=52693 RepID=A0A923HU98_9FIRM|nr:hypothetical protein [Acetobacterium paludosum]MBC3887822.1 hypothetical protein [Acetobacterium paludosum]